MAPSELGRQAKRKTANPGQTKYFHWPLGSTVDWRGSLVISFVAVAKCYVASWGQHRHPARTYAYSDTADTAHIVLDCSRILMCMRRLIDRAGFPLTCALPVQCC